LGVPPWPSPRLLPGWLAAPAPVDAAGPAQTAAASTRARVSTIAAGALDPMYRPPQCVARLNYVYFDIVVFSASVVNRWAAHDLQARLRDPRSARAAAPHGLCALRAAPAAARLLLVPRHSQIYPELRKLLAQGLVRFTAGP